MTALWSQYSNALYGIIHRTVQDNNYAEEVLQDTLMKIWKNIDSFDDNKASFFTWASTVARNSALDRVRLKSYNRSIKTKDIDNTVPPNTSQIHEAGLDVQRIVSILDDKHKEIIEASYLQGFTQREISDNLNIPLGTVKTRMRKGIHLLRDYLRDEEKYFL